MMKEQPFIQKDLCCHPGHVFHVDTIDGLSRPSSMNQICTKIDDDGYVSYHSTPRCTVVVKKRCIDYPLKSYARKEMYMYCLGVAGSLLMTVMISK